MGLPVSTESAQMQNIHRLSPHSSIQTYESIDTFSTKMSHLRQGCLCKELPRPPARGLHCRKAPALVFARCPQTLASPDRRSLSHKASSALPALVPGPLLARPAHGFWLRLQSEDQAVLARGVHTASCLWPLALVTALDGARAPGGSPGLDQSWGCHCRDHQVLLHCKGSGPSGSKVQGHDDIRGPGGGDGLVSRVLGVGAVGLSAPGAHVHGHPVEVLAPLVPARVLDGDGAVGATDPVAGAQGGRA